MTDRNEESVRAGGSAASGATVLVTDGEQRSSLAAVRSLGRAGFRVLACSHRTPSLAGASRWCAAETGVPSPLSQPAAFAEAVLSLCHQRRADLLLPMTDASILAVLPCRDDLGPTLLPMPDLEAFRAVSDKRRLLETAAGLGIAVPCQAVLERPEAVEGFEDLDLPLVVKPSRSLVEEGTRRVRVGVAHAADRSSLLEFVAALPAAAYPVLLQRPVVGPGVGVFLLRWDGRILAAFAHRRIREKPPSGGVSVYRESIPLDEDLTTRSAALLEAHGWQGVAMVEFKLQGEDGTPHLMEVNGRFWGSLQLAVDAGVDFPALLVRAALGDPPEPVREYRVGIRSRWWWGDVDHLLARLRRQGADAASGRESRLDAVADFLKLWRPGDRSEVLRLGDPRPFLRESVGWLGSALETRRRLGRAGSRP